MEQNQRREFLIRELLQEEANYHDIQMPEDCVQQKILLRSLLNVRPPRKSSSRFLEVQNAYLQEEVREKGIVKTEDLTPVKEGIYIWQGDITTLECDAIVNAANSGMTGCYVPNHACIDNCIHTFAGVQLRFRCAEIMEIQGYEEPAGQAKITPAYNLPCRYVLHTVGPVIQQDYPTSRDCQLLASCYQSCLKLAATYELESVAFCCISTGVFHFPNDRAAEIAVQTVREFLKKQTSVRKVIFNVFKDMDKEIYERLLR
jgi:O-acetyl-ADP-ribose deacetylase (regulator of RNase III)